MVSQSIGAFIDRFRIAPVAYRPLHYELALGFEASADILESEDVTIGDQVPVAFTQTPLVVVRAIGSALEQYGQRLPGGARHKNNGVQLGAIAHRDHRVGLDEYRGDVRGILRALLSQSNRGRAIGAAPISQGSAITGDFIFVQITETGDAPLCYRRFRDPYPTQYSCRNAGGRCRVRSAPMPNWKPKLGVLCDYSDSNLAFVKAEGFTSMQLRLDPDRVDDAAIAAIKDKIQQSGIYVSSLAVDGNHIDPDPARRAHQNQYAAKCIELCGKLGIPNIGGQSGTIKGKPLAEQVDEIVRVYHEKYFPLCEQHHVRILWEPYAGGPNIATGPVGWEALFKAFHDSPHVGLQFDPSHLVWQFMDPVQAAREFADKIYDSTLRTPRFSGTSCATPTYSR